MIKNRLYSQKWTPLIVLVFRLVIGVVFVFSGFVKAIDPWGVLYKLEEYTAAMGLDWLSPFLLFGAFAISIVEFCLGVCLLVGAYRRVSVWLSMVLMVVMTVLTGWLAMSDAVTDCGCFGDVIVMSNTATFVKNIVLLAMVAYLMRYNVRLFNTFGHDVHWLVVVISAGFALSVASYGYFYQPMLDFRPYKVGVPLIGEDKMVDDSEFVFVYEQNGEKREFTIDNLPAEDDSTWQFVERRELKLHSEDDDAMGLSITDGDEDVTADVLSADGDKLIFVYSQMNDIGISYTYLINILDDFARKVGADVLGVADASPEEIENWKDVSMATYPIYTSDGTSLKMLARGNPAVVYVKEGKVVWKRTLQSIDAATVESSISGGGDLESIVADYDGEQRLKYLSISYVIILILVLILNRSYRVYKISAGLIEKNKNKSVTLQKENKSEN
ncbi:MAG: DoxX family protein [Muribaculaceae bacterium]|nr:DoxX family protein [Muribaculaceae bacterium]